MDMGMKADARRTRKAMLTTAFRRHLCRCTNGHYHGPSLSAHCKTVLRRSWLGGSRYTSVETIGDAQPVDPSVVEPAL